MIRIRFLCFIFISLFHVSFAASRFTFKGRIVDEKTGKPVYMVNVFLANSTIGTATDEKGYFELKRIPQGEYILFIHHIGYENRSLPINVPVHSLRPYRIKLNPVVLEGERIEVSAKDAASWRKKLEIFKSEFIGVTGNATQCTLFNPYVLDFNTDVDGTLHATADEAFIVMNRALGYRLKIFLKSFSYHEKDLIYYIYPHFEELTPENSLEKVQWEKNRLKTWEGSVRHFFSLIAKGDFNNKFFKVYKGMLNTPMTIIEQYHPPVSSPNKNKPPRFIKSGPMDGAKRIEFKNALIVQYRDFTRLESAFNDKMDTFPTSYLIMTCPSATVNVFGNTQPIDAFKVFGEWAKHRVANLLPLDYMPEKEI